MNMILYRPGELGRDRLSPREKLTIDGDRARHLLKARHLGVGARLRVGMLGASIFFANVCEVRKNELVVEIEDEQCAVPAVPPVELIVALPRPQILKRVLETVAAMGASRLMLIRSKRVEKSYFNSKLLAEEGIRRHLALGLEQAVCTKQPAVEIYKSFKAFTEEVLPAVDRTARLRLIADPLAPQGLEQLAAAGDGRVVCAIGPEGGWEDFELEAFARRGYLPFRLGERILRVDTAVCAVLAQIDLWRKLE